MALLTTPLVLNDGTSDHTFEARGPLTNLKKNQTGSDYIESAADLAADSKIVVKHDNGSSVPRHLLQYTRKDVPASASDGIRRQKTYNFTFVGSEEFSAAEIALDFAVFLNLLAESGLIDGMRKDKL